MGYHVKRGNQICPSTSSGTGTLPAAEPVEAI